MGEWDTLGFRGTCSPGFVLRATGDVRSVLDEPYADISTGTMLPDCPSPVVRRSGSASPRRPSNGPQVRPGRGPAQARDTPTGRPPPGRAGRRAPAVHRHGAVVAGPLRGGRHGPDRLSAIGFAVGMNALKVSASTLVVDIVRECMLICGMARTGWTRPTPWAGTCATPWGRPDGQQRPDPRQQRPAPPRPAGGVRTVSDDRRPPRPTAIATDEPWSGCRRAALDDGSC